MISNTIFKKPMNQLFGAARESGSRGGYSGQGGGDEGAMPCAGQLPIALHEGAKPL